MADATKDFEELLVCLKRHEARFVVVGAHAVAYHAKPRYTKHFDLLVESSAANGERLVAALEEFGFAGLGMAAEDFSAPGKILQLGHPPNRVDLMTSIDGVSFDEIWDGRAEGAYGTVRVPFIGRDALMKNKRASGRPQDLYDLELLRRIRN